MKLFRIEDYILVLIGLTAYTFGLGAFAAWGPTFLNRVHGLELSFADQFFGGMLVIAGLLGTLIGGFAATTWHRKSRAGYAYLLTLSAAMTVLAATAAFLSTSTQVSMICLGAAMFFAFLPTGPINTLLLESVPVSLRASAMAASIFVIHLFGDFWSPVIVGQSGRLGLPGGQSRSRTAKRDAHSARCVQPFHPVLGLARLEAAEALSKRRHPANEYAAASIAWPSASRDEKSNNSVPGRGQSFRRSSPVEGAIASRRFVLPIYFNAITASFLRGH